jgi:hypothetical protein
VLHSVASLNGRARGEFLSPPAPEFAKMRALFSTFPSLSVLPSCNTMRTELLTGFSETRYAY